MDNSNLDVQEIANMRPKALEERELGTKKITHLFYRYILLAILGNLFLAVTSFVDGNILGNLGATELAGVGIGFTIMVLSRAIGTLVGVGAGAVAALRLGAGKIDEARSIIGQSIWFGIILSTMIGVVGYIYNEPLMRFFGADDQALPYAIQFGNYMWISFPFTVLAVILSVIAILDERPGLSVWSWFVGAILAAAVELLLFHKFQYGIIASAWANIISQSTPCLLIFYFLFSKTLLKPKLKDLKMKLRDIWEVNATGFAAFSISLTMFIAVIIINNLLASLGGELHISAFAIQNGYITNFLILIVMGIVTGIQPIISYNYGAKLYDRVREATRLGIIFTFIVSTFLTLVLFFLADPIVSFFTGGDDALQDIGIWSTRVFNVSFPFVAIIVLISGYFEAIEQNVKATFIGIGRSFLFSLPLFYIFPKMYGIEGVWYSIPVADMIAFVVAILFMYKEFQRLKHMNKNEKYRG
ncbi:MATE family efflux transporter [Bacillus pseudomycoides]|uniref:MATE family efflux transporter n=1 Tax=Bacillus pseudomycoides TaxID=64104 RepID=UPI001FB323CC|nr:MATE family efflux transporter [Bacillus pseudomycoides]